VILKFILEGEVKRIIDSEDPTWQEAINFGNVPDGWIELKGGSAFIEVDRDTERPAVLRNKFEKYIAFKESGGYRNLFPDCAFKVLVFATTEERIESLERIASSEDIWFCAMEEFLREPLDHAHWFALRGFYALPAVPKEEV
jgi:hypothetical protein